MSDLKNWMFPYKVEEFAGMFTIWRFGKLLGRFRPDEACRRLTKLLMDSDDENSNLVMMATEIQTSLMDLQESTINLLAELENVVAEDHQAPEVIKAIGLVRMSLDKGEESQVGIFELIDDEDEDEDEDEDDLETL